MGYRPQKTSLDPKLRPLDQFGFSSQFFFMALLGVAANIFLIIGLMIILESLKNPYFDIMILILLCLNQLVIFLIESISIFLRKKLKIWESSIDPSSPRKHFLFSEFPALTKEHFETQGSRPG